MAVCFPHEIRMHQGDRAVTFVQTELARFGYGMPDCRVFRYWEDGFPLRTEGAEMRALLLAKDGKAMIALGNFGPEGVAGPESEAGPTLEEYDAQQLGLATAPVPAEPTERRESAEAYTIRFQLDLAALGVAESAQAWDVELKAGRQKAENSAAINVPAQPGVDLKLSTDDKDDPMLGQEKHPAQLKRLAPGVFELTIAHHDFALIVVE